MFAGYTPVAVEDFGEVMVDDKGTTGHVARQRLCCELATRH